MKNWKITLATIFLCCIITSCSDKKTTDVTKQVDEQQITQECQKEDEEKTTSSSSNSSTSKENWDAILQDYEKFIDQYIVFMKKAKKGDASVMQNAMELVTKAGNLAKKLDNAKQKDLTPSQADKFEKLQEKFKNAVAKGLNN